MADVTNHSEFFDSLKRAILGEKWDSKDPKMACHLPQLIASKYLSSVRPRSIRRTTHCASTWPLRRESRSVFKVRTKIRRFPFAHGFGPGGEPVPAHLLELTATFEVLDNDIPLALSQKVLGQLHVGTERVHLRRTVAVGRGEEPPLRLSDSPF